jgi:hypothetical protein
LPPIETHHRRVAVNTFAQRGAQQASRIANDTNAARRPDLASPPLCEAGSLFGHRPGGGRIAVLQHTEKATLEALSAL